MKLTDAVLMVAVDTAFFVVVPMTSTVLVIPTVLNDVWVHLAVVVTVCVGGWTSMHYIVFANKSR
jgi:hypothetical protein